MTVSSAVGASAVARAVGIETKFSDLRGGEIQFLPQRIAVIGQGATASTYATTKRQVTSALEAGQLYGFGSPVHLALRQLLPANGDGVGSIPVTVYPLEDDGSGVASAGDITPSGAPTMAQSYQVKINNILSEAFVVAAADTVAAIVTAMTTAINAVVDMPVVASDDTTEVGIASKWKGASANDIVIEIVSPATAEISFAITQPVSGATNPEIDDALAQVGDIWETLILNCFEIADTTTLTTYNTFGVGRWGALTHKPCVVFTGVNDTTVAAAIAVSDARKTDRVNAQLVAPGSNDLPLVIAARQLARIAVVANSNPPRDYGSQDASGIVPGVDGDQWTYLDRDQAVKAGSSTIEVKDSVVNISDVVTFYHPDGDPTPAYRYVVDIIKLQNILYNMALIFNTAEWDGAPLIPDDQPTTNRAAKQPKAAKAEIAAMLDSLGGNAIISDPKTAKANTVAEISATNPKRLDISLVVQLSGNVNIISADLNFGFFFG